jgi:hypothetical protein
MIDEEPDFAAFERLINAAPEERKRSTDGHRAVLATGA